MAAEKQFENRVKRYLETLGVYPLGCAHDKMTVPPVGYYEKRWGGGYSKAGLPDMHIVVNGINLDVELKAPTGRPSELQKFMVVQINECGSIGLILWPEGFPEFKKIIEGVMQCSIHILALKHLKNAHSNTKCNILTG